MSPQSQLIKLIYFIVYNLKRINDIKEYGTEFFMSITITFSNTLFSISLKPNTIIFPAISLECSTRETVFIDIVFLHLRADYLSKLM